MEIAISHVKPVWLGIFDGYGLLNNVETIGSFGWPVAKNCPLVC
jgi:hypothetical protein